MKITIQANGPYVVEGVPLVCKRQVVTELGEPIAWEKEGDVMVERCPSGSYTYALEGSEGDIEPDLPKQMRPVEQQAVVRRCAPDSG